VEEPVLSNPYLGDYYLEPARWALAMQLDLLTQRALAAHAQQDTAGIQFFDRSLIGDQIFARAVYQMGLMEEREYETYRKVFASLTVQVQVEPELLVYLQAPPEVVFNRIQARNRPEETEGPGIPYEYLVKVWEEYEMYMKGSMGNNILVINWSSFQPAEAVLNQLRPYV